jgi:hypothetical protein
MTLGNLRPARLGGSRRPGLPRGEVVRLSLLQAVDQVLTERLSLVVAGKRRVNQRREVLQVVTGVMPDTVVEASVHLVLLSQFVDAIRESDFASDPRKGPRCMCCRRPLRRSRQRCLWASPRSPQ